MPVNPKVEPNYVWFNLWAKVWLNASRMLAFDWHLIQGKGSRIQSGIAIMFFNCSFVSRKIYKVEEVVTQRGYWKMFSD